MLATCGVCGIRRLARQERGYLCGTCRPMLRVQPDEKDALPPGRWYTTKGGVAVWRPLDRARVQDHQERTIIRILTKSQGREAA